jgi:hypothetical protein
MIILSFSSVIIAQMLMDIILNFIKEFFYLFIYFISCLERKFFFSLPGPKSILEFFPQQQQRFVLRGVVHAVLLVRRHDDDDVQHYHLRFINVNIIVVHGV